MSQLLQCRNYKYLSLHCIKNAKVKVLVMIRKGMKYDQNILEKERDGTTYPPLVCRLTLFRSALKELRIILELFTAPAAK